MIVVWRLKESWRCLKFVLEFNVVGYPEVDLGSGGGFGEGITREKKKVGGCYRGVGGTSRPRPRRRRLRKRVTRSEARLWRWNVVPGG